MPPNVGANRNWDTFPVTPIAGHRPSPGSPWPRQRARIPSEAIGTTHSRGSRFTSNPNRHVHVPKGRRNSLMAHPKRLELSVKIVVERVRGCLTTSRRRFCLPSTSAHQRVLW